MKAMSARQHKVATELQHQVAMALLQGRVHSTLPLSRLNVVNAWISADLRSARIFLATPAELSTPEVFAHINAEIAKPLRHYLASQLALKNIPALAFFPETDQ